MMENRTDFASKIINAILFVWQIIQIAVGSIVVKIEGVKHQFTVLGVRFVYSVGFVGFKSYGPIAVIDARRYRSQGVLNRRTSKLVIAYARISRILGPLFIPYLVISSFKFKGKRLDFACRWAESIAGIQ